MKRRELLALGLAAPALMKLRPPESGEIPVAFLVSEGAVIIDFCGPWEVFQDAGRFRLYTVAETTRPIRASGGMQIVPDYDFASAPAPKIVVIPAQRGGRNKAAVDWLRKSAAQADLTMSVCTGAFVLAGAGLLSGKSATTHHSSYATFAMAFPDVRLQRGVRFVDEGTIASAGGLTSGIDLALHAVERYFGRDAAKSTADYMEYQGQGWLDARSNGAYARPPKPAAGRAICPVCWMDLDPAAAPQSVYRGVTYSFCSTDHKQQFDAAPQRFLDLAQ
jgi:transcriptional regulator GlxA family with amidase domain/YHS domain-containing protein